MAQPGYGGHKVEFAPGGFKAHGEWAMYLAAHHMLLAHARAAEIYKNEFKDEQNGRGNFFVAEFWD